jgi:hypothetical protein
MRKYTIVNNPELAKQDCQFSAYSLSWTDDNINFHIIQTTFRLVEHAKAIMENHAQKNGLIFRSWNTVSESPLMNEYAYESR